MSFSVKIKESIKSVQRISIFSGQCQCPCNHHCHRHCNHQFHDNFHQDLLTTWLPHGNVRPSGPLRSWGLDVPTQARSTHANSDSAPGGTKFWRFFINNCVIDNVDKTDDVYMTLMKFVLRPTQLRSSNHLYRFFPPTFAASRSRLLSVVFT